MATKLLRRALLLLAGASALLLASCGGDTVESQFNPDRIVVFGDAMADLGQNGHGYTINNDGTVGNWTTFLANAYARSLATSASGGFSYATGNARITQDPDAAGNSATPTVAEQVSAFLGANSAGEKDLVIFSAGTSDVITAARSAREGLISAESAIEAMDAAAGALADQVRRILAAGVTHVVVVGPYNLGRSIWALQLSEQAELERLSQRFNERFLVSVVNEGARVLYIDAAFYFNLVTSSPSNYDISNVSETACVSMDPGPGIGTGSNQVNSNLCTTSTLRNGIDRNDYLFADRIYPTPRGHQLFGDYAVNRLRDRW